MKEASSQCWASLNFYHVTLMVIQNDTHVQKYICTHPWLLHTFPVNKLCKDTITQWISRINTWHQQIFYHITFCHLKSIVFLLIAAREKMVWARDWDLEWHLSWEKVDYQV